MHASPTAAILDPAGLSRLYNAKTTPHMFVIDPQGKLMYEGAIDDQPSTDPATARRAQLRECGRSKKRWRVSL